MTARAARLPALAALLAAALVAGCLAGAPAPTPVALRLQVSLTPEEMASFRPALERVDEAHAGWTVSLEAVPQGSESERVTTQLAADDLPDVLRLQGLTVQQWMRRSAFADLSAAIEGSELDLADFYDGPLDQYRWNGTLYGLPDTATPEVVFYDTAAFAEAGLDAPGDDWTYEDMRRAAVELTVDGAGRHAGDAGFDPADIARWGWNRGLVHYWQNEDIRALGGDLCANEDCTLMSFTSPETVRAVEWWVSLVRDDHAALYDPFGGSQTGVEGDPFNSGAAAMGANGSFAIGQLNAAGNIEYDIAPPLIGLDGERHTSVSVNGYVISAATEHPAQAWELVEALLEPEFLSETWGRPAHAVPARRSAAESVIDLSHPPRNQAAILEAMEAGVVFRPHTSRAFDAYGATIDIFRRMNTGEITVEEGVTLLEDAANEALAADRSP